MAGLVMLTGSSALAGRAQEVVAATYPDARFVIERSGSRLNNLRQRVARRGVVRAAGQVGFRALHARMTRHAKPRVDAMWEASGLPREPVDPSRVHGVDSLNSDAAHDIIRTLAPDVAIVFSARKLSGATIAACDAPILNLHPGITPAYRGVHTGYWALRRNDAANFGATVHLIDEGLDTGPIVEQVFCRREGSVATYNTVLVLAGLPALFRAVSAAKNGDLKTSPAGPPAPLFFEPTLWSYLVGGVSRGVW